ncbi:hypothetical protein ACF0H5_023294 [Mactra antiquata]
MAHNQQSLRSRIKEDFLTCSICFNKFIQPKALPCLHTYCLDCLQDYVNSFGTVGKFPCPMCRQEVTIPAQGLSGLPDNYMVANLVDTVEEEASSTPAVPPRPTNDTNRLPGKPVPAPRSISPQPPRASPTPPAIPPRPKSVSPVPQSLSNPSEPPRQTNVQNPASNLGHLVTEGIGGVVGAVGSAISDISGYLVPQKPTNMQETPMSPFEFVPRPNDNENNAASQDTQPGGGLYPNLVTSHGAKPCSNGLLLSFGKFGRTVYDMMKPFGLAVGKNGEFIITDRAGSRIFVYNNNGEFQSSFTANCKVNGVAVTRDNQILLAVSQSGSAIMRLYSMDGKLINSYGNYYKFDVASGIAVTPSNHVAVTNLAADNVLIFTEQRKFSVKFGWKGRGQNHFSQPSSITSTSKDYLVVADTGNHCVKLFDIESNFKRSFGSQGNGHGQLNSPLGVATDKEDFIIVADTGNFRVEIYTVKGEFFSTLVKDTNLIGPDVRPINVAVTPKNNICVLLIGTGFCEVRVFHWKPVSLQGQTV